MLRAVCWPPACQLSVQEGDSDPLSQARVKCRVIYSSGLPGAPLQRKPEELRPPVLMKPCLHIQAGKAEAEASHGLLQPAFPVTRQHLFRDYKFPGCKVTWS